MHNVRKVAVALVVLGGLAAATPAGAQPATAPMPQSVAGYLLSETGVGQVSARFTVPTVTCTGAVPSSGSILGAELFGPNPLIAGFEVGCSGTTPIYAAVFGNNSGPIEVFGLVNPGDVVTVWLKQAIWPKDGKPFYQSKLADLTTNWGTGPGGSTTSAVTEAALGVIGLNCAADGCAPVAPFTRVSFASSKLNGTSLAGSTHSTLTALDGTSEANAGSFDTKTQSRFAASWASTCTPPDSNGRC
jgi:hypothetical protein